jgi:predicted GIY-YIG superfamily endonuclease
MNKPPHLEEAVFVYAFRDRASGEFLYVGQAVDPNRRRREHETGKNAQFAAMPLKPEFVILRRSNYRHVSRIEAQIICSLRKRGQCRLDRNDGLPAARKPIFPTYPVYWIEGGLTFTGPCHAARHFGISHAPFATLFEAVESYMIQPETFSTLQTPMETWPNHLAILNTLVRHRSLSWLYTCIL